MEDTIIGQSFLILNQNIQKVNAFMFMVFPFFRSHSEYTPLLPEFCEMPNQYYFNSDYRISNPLHVTWKWGVRTNMKQKQKKKSIFDMQNLMILTVVLFLGLGVFAIFNSNTSSSESRPQKPVQFDYSKQPAIGSPDAPVKLMEFGDFKCPACKAFHDTIYPQLKKEYIDTGKVQMHFTNYQFLGEDSITAGIAGESVYRQNPEAFWKFYESIYANQGKESVTWATPEFLTQLVKKHIPEVEAEQVAKDIKNKTYEKDVLADNDLAQKSHVESVPAIFINGKQVEQSLDYNELKNAIESELKKK